jgi:hypothetical protein
MHELPPPSMITGGCDEEEEEEEEDDNDVLVGAAGFACREGNNEVAKWRGCGSDPAASPEGCPSHPFFPPPFRPLPPRKNTYQSVKARPLFKILPFILQWRK